MVQFTMKYLTFGECPTNPTSGRVWAWGFRV